MSSNKPPKKKVVVTTGKKKESTASRQKSRPTSRKKGGSRASRQEAVELTFGKQSFIWMGIGAVVMILGYALMTGGAQAGPDVWDDNQIYHWRRTLLAPVVILLGIGIEIYAIFKK